MGIIQTVKNLTKDSYKEAICAACDDIKNRVDDILCDFDKHLSNISITLNVGIGEVSVIKITKEVYVEGENNGIMD